MRARDLVYHLHCFTCAWCNTALTQGDYFGLRDNLVYCRGHYELMVHGENCLTTNGEAAAPALMPRYPGLTLLHPGHEPPSSPSTGAFAPFPGVTGSVRKGRPRKRKTTDAVVREGLLSQTLMMESADGCGLHLSSLDSNSSGPSGPGGGPGGSQRTKRMRTSFKHHQLRTMKSYFAINQNPDAKDLKQLAQKTGLSKRVLQVWFQNARAKWRRNNLRQVDHQQGGSNSQNPQQSSQSSHVNSPGATSSFSEPSPCGGGSGMGPEPPHASSLPPPAPPSVMDYDGNPPLTSLVPRHVSPGGEPLPLTSFQELF
ncbi:LIM/homeobox protein Lhx9-like [Uloborus diversus]|uniref:LIM/homeobox protein Lhx9-like n=1 Tax=Uloborus diversus TaxID=327109 RepID=UPI00240A0918|nr:LIM/homeobox protein Lhx9-like [Uloborus diversus]